MRQAAQKNPSIGQGYVTVMKEKIFYEGFFKGTRLNG
jgi:hypothetical protein